MRWGNDQDGGGEFFKGYEATELSTKVTHDTIDQVSIEERLTKWTGIP